MSEDDSLDSEFEKDNGPSSAYARSIELPAEEIFRNLHNAKRFAIDIGDLSSDYCISICMFLLMKYQKGDIHRMTVILICDGAIFIVHNSYCLFVYIFIFLFLFVCLSMSWYFGSYHTY